MKSKNLFELNENWKIIFNDLTKVPLTEQHEKVRQDINDAVEEFLNKNNNDDFTKKDIIVRKVNGKYVASHDKKRVEKIKKIFKDE